MHAVQPAATVGVEQDLCRQPQQCVGMSSMFVNAIERKRFCCYRHFAG